MFLRKLSVHGNSIYRKLFNRKDTLLKSERERKDGQARPEFRWVIVTNFVLAQFGKGAQEIKINIKSKRRNGKLRNVPAAAENKLNFVR